MAGYGEPDVDRLLTDPGIVRNRRKIEATIHYARVMWDLIQEHGSYHDYLRSLDDLEYAGRREELGHQFRRDTPQPLPCGRVGVPVSVSECVSQGTHAAQSRAGKSSFAISPRWWYTFLSGDCSGCLMSPNGRVQANGNEGS